MESIDFYQSGCNFKKKRGLMIKANDKVDLHMHSTASDGTWSIETLLNEIKKEGIKVFSITDHDSIESIGVVEQSNIENLHYIRGVELSATYEEVEYHITAYDFDANNTRLIALIESNRKKRLAHNKKTIDYIHQIGLLNDIKDFQNYTYDKSRGGWESLNYLIDKKIAVNLEAYFEIVRSSNEKMIFEHPAKVIEIVKQAGGFCCLAHPSAYQSGKLLPEKTLDQWKTFGIHGIECYSPYLAVAEDAKYYTDYCNKNNLFITAGSDCHGTFNDRKLGSPNVHYKDIRIKSNF